MSEQTALEIHGETAQIGVMLQTAVEKGVPVEVLERIVALHERVSDRAAAMEFARAMAAFQAECPPIPKTSRASIVTKSGAKFGYSYAELDEIARVVRPLLHANGLSYTWDSTLADGKMRVICIVRHVNGHSQSATFEAPLDGEARMSGAQAHAAALTYGRRQSLVQALGLTTCDPDADAGHNAEPLSKEQAANIEALLDELPDQRARLLKWAGVERVADIPASRYAAAVKALEAKR